MNKQEAKVASKRIREESSKLNHAPLVTLFEIDLSEIAIDETLSRNLRLASATQALAAVPDMIFRFHNNMSLLKPTVGAGAVIAPPIWFGGVKYVAAPIQASGFEVSTKGTLPRPKLSLTVNTEGVEFISILKNLMKDLGDLSNAKVTRIRTFSKYLDYQNFYVTNGDGSKATPERTIVERIPDDLTPDPNATLPKDIYYIDRKSMEDKQSLEFELSSILELDGMVLPSRLMAQRRCTFNYRGEGCCYEYGQDNNDNQCFSVADWKKIHRSTGASHELNLPNLAPPMANEKDELLGGSKGVVRNKKTDSGGNDISDDFYVSNSNTNKPNCWKKNTVYPPKSAVYINVAGINYYYVAKFWDCDADGNNCGNTSVPSNEPPPNTKYWEPDVCSKTIKGCKIRWNAGTPAGMSSSNPFKGSAGVHLPFGGWPGINRKA